MTSSRPRRPSVLRILLCSLLMWILVVASLYLHHTAIPFYAERLADSNMKTIAWFLKQAGFALPFILIAVFQYMVYHRHDTHDGIARREMLWEVILVAALTYLVLLPLVLDLSDRMYEAALLAGAKIPKTDGGAPWTLAMKLHEWFIRLAIPLSLLCLFHGTRASREIHEPEEPDLPVPPATPDPLPIPEVADATPIKEIES